MENWQERFRAHLEATGKTQTELGKALGLTQGAIGHWLSGIREINLTDFFRLCRAAGANPRVILFGASTEGQAVLDQVRRLLGSDPRQNSNYQSFENHLAAEPKPRYTAKKPRKTRA